LPMVTFIIKEKTLIKSTVNSTVIAIIRQIREKANIGHIYVHIYFIYY
jgi:hypothetical protein